MENNKNLKILKNGQEVLIFNRTNSKSVKINRYIYNIIKNINNVDDINIIAEDYIKNDKEFFSILRNTFEKHEILRDCSLKSVEKIDFVITDFCNLNCTHCCHSSFYVNDEHKNIVADINVLKAIIKYNPKSIGLTGGEPMIVSNFTDVMNCLKNSYNGKTTLATNGTLISKENAKMICECFNVIDMSIDGITEEKSDAIRGKGTFNKVINAIKLLNQNNVQKISLSIVLDHNTKNDREKFIEMCKKLNVEPVVRRMNVIGRAKLNHTDSNKYDGFMDGQSFNICNCYDCPGGVNSISVNYKGDVFPCNLFTENEYKIGDIFENNLINKLEWNKKHKWFKAFSKYIPDTREECKNCEINTFCWDCPSLARTFLDNNNVANLSKICEKKYNDILEVLWNE